MVFCNEYKIKRKTSKYDVTILILIDGFLQWDSLLAAANYNNVTILILIDGFLQFKKQIYTIQKYK